MLADIAKARRENLIQDIFSVLGQWPEIERSVFCQAHYQGQSVESISRSLQLNTEEVRQILKQCDRRLHAFLRNVRKNGVETPWRPVIEPAYPAA